MKKFLSFVHQLNSKRYLIVSLILFYGSVSKAITPSEVENLILEATTWFPQKIDLCSDAEGYQVFFKHKYKDKVEFQSQLNNNATFQVPKTEGDKRIVIVNKPFDGLPESETSTYVVLIQSTKQNEKYSAHKAYIRRINGKMSVEWDVFKTTSSVVDYESFYSALVPSTYYSLKAENIGQGRNGPRGANNHPLPGEGEFVGGDGNIEMTRECIDYLRSYCKSMGSFPTTDKDPCACRNIICEMSPGRNYYSVFTFGVKTAGAKVSTTTTATNKPITSTTTSTTPSSTNPKTTTAPTMITTMSNKKPRKSSQAEPRFINLPKPKVKTVTANPGVFRRTHLAKEPMCTTQKCTKKKNTKQKHPKNHQNLRSDSTLKYHDDSDFIYNHPVQKKIKKWKANYENMDASSEKQNINYQIKSTQYKYPKSLEDFPDSFQSSFLGPFYSDILNSTYDKNIEKEDPDQLRFKMKQYTIYIDYATGHRRFESNKMSFTGIMPCDYEEISTTDFNSALVEKNIVDFYLQTLRAQCLPQTRISTLGLFNRNLVQIHGTGSQHPEYVELDKAKLFNRKTLNKKQWTDFISAITFAKYTEAFNEQQEGLDIHYNLLKNGHPISHSVCTLTLMVEKILDILHKKQFEIHAVKISKALLIIVREWIRKIQEQEVMYTIFCNNCKYEVEMQRNDLYHLNLLNHYIIYGSVDAVQNNLREFNTFYKSKS